MDFKFSLNEQEAQKILDILVKEPYREVFQLIGKIQGQAHDQKQKDVKEENT